jgi:hypothetical protein
MVCVRDENHACYSCVSHTTVDGLRMGTMVDGHGSILYDSHLPLVLKTTIDCANKNTWTMKPARVAACAHTHGTVWARCSAFCFKSRKKTDAPSKLLRIVVCYDRPTCHHHPKKSPLPTPSAIFTSAHGNVRISTISTTIRSTPPRVDPTRIAIVWQLLHIARVLF